MNDIEWIRSFTGMQVADPSDPSSSESGDQDAPAVDLAAQADAFEADARRKAVLLALVRKDIAVIKKRFQDAMSQEVKLKETYIANWHKKAKLLNIEATQLEEGDFEELLLTQETEFAPGTQAIINAGNMVIADSHEKLKSAVDAQGEPLFSREELEREFWTPLMRERVLPETFIADAYSLTRQMIDETNALYIEESAKRTANGTANEKRSALARGLDAGKATFALAGSVAGNFGPSGEIAGKALQGVGMAIDSGQKLAEALEKAEWGDVTAIGLTTIKGLTASLLTGFGVPKDTVKIVESSIDGAGAAAKAAAKFATGPKGVAEGIDCLVDALASGLTAGVSGTKGEDEKDKNKVLSNLSDFLPGAIKVAVGGGKLLKNVRDGDPEEAMRSLNAALVEAFKLARADQRNKMTEGMDDDAAEQASEEFDAETEGLEKQLESVLEASPEVAARVAEKSRMAAYRAGIGEIVDDVATGLEAAFTKAGLPPQLGDDVAQLYGTLAKPEAVLDLLFKTGFDAAAAAAPLATALRKCFAKMAADAPALAGLAASRADALTTAAEKIAGRMKAQLETVQNQDAKSRSYEPVMDIFLQDMRKGAVAALDVDALADALRDANKDGFADKAQTRLTEQKLDLAKAEVEQEMADMQLGMDGMSEAQLAGAAASDIDALIAKLQRDRLIINMAVKVMSGGADMLAQVVPGLGVAAAGIRLIAELTAAAERAVQLKRWIDNQDDFEAAQSVLSSASRNFVRNQATQLTDHSINAALQLAKMIAEAAKLAGPAAKAGVVASIVVSAVQSAKDIIKDIYDEQELENAWSLFEKSMANPANRRLALQVRAAHPTLAKYTIAWGAQVKGDLLAKNAFRACKLNEASLRNPDSDVNKVVEYLEVFYEEDQQLYRSLTEALDWVPQPVLLTLRSWTQVKSAAAKAKQWDSPSTGTVDGLLSKLEQATSAVASASEAREAAAAGPAGLQASDLQSCIDALKMQKAVLDKLSVALDGVVPTAAKGDAEVQKKFKETVLSGLAAKARTQAGQAEVALAAASDQLQKLPVKPAKPVPPPRQRPRSATMPPSTAKV